MSTKSKLELRISEIRTELRKIAEATELTPELRESADALKTELADCETRLQAAILADDQKPEPESNGGPDDPETRERLELRKKVTLTGYLLQAATGRQEPEYREYQAACEASSAEIPFDLLEPTEAEQRAVTPAPSSGTGVSVQRIVPAVFAMSAAPLLGIEMPRVGSGTSSWLRITTNQTAGFNAKGDAQAATAGALTPVNTTPHRISARLEINAEAVAEVGIGTFETQLRANLASVLSDALDKALINGDGTGNNISGLITTKGAPTAETTTDTWTLARKKITDLTDGIFARSMAD
ncbi:MAG: phage major capsid protein, partial [Chloroflexi bacterium]|nr:phage major capsid protein [Chloroflexota bacterium]